MILYEINVSLFEITEIFTFFRTFSFYFNYIFFMCVYKSKYKLDSKCFPTFQHFNKLIRRISNPVKTLFISIISGQYFKDQTAAD